MKSFDDVMEKVINDYMNEARKILADDDEKTAYKMLKSMYSYFDDMDAYDIFFSWLDGDPVLGFVWDKYEKDDEDDEHDEDDEEIVLLYDSDKKYLSPFLGCSEAESLKDIKKIEFYPNRDMKKITKKTGYFYWID